ncbi:MULTISPECIES: ArsR/SmtB family transcription factor [Streptococcus]|uniref:ArsR/SmtB family transcription factor n=1 Tax=Streptococcus TaxID=1301 RepID=UPI000CF59A80|nr:ArsR family transcriptional regulator [Streptococcus suis]MBM0194282.1 ArsR family transcriptional regulator [Streptococcus suis]MBM7315746.1 ArsR family transcriptional regulator [Streptococcus suis]HEM5028909.1 ArsR family transcriptional regulator [Streptococcus suis]HEM5104018.1 ArsR family transcriptional regulator [Streptococcus suis]HEM5155852.1 ArsR family transcriptional regulator [Streptococcus suis]
MKLDYRDYRSEIVEKFFIPLIVKEREEPFEADLSQKEKDILKDALDIRNEVESKLADFRQEVNEVFVWGHIFTILHTLYFYLLDQGQDPKTVEEACQLILALSQEEVEDAMRTMLASENDGHREKDLSLMELMEKTDKKPAEKWYWSLALRNPLETVQRSVHLLDKMLPIYQPYFEQARVEREAFARDFDIEQLYRESKQLAMTSLDSLSVETAQFFVLSPWNYWFAYYGNEQFDYMKVALLASCRIDQMMLSNDELDLDDLTNALKVISDSTRYQVLVELTKPHAKSKDIAERLNITGAAVSFHTQKLINGDLLLFNTKNSDVKYSVNRDLLLQMIDKLKEDFDL